MFADYQKQVLQAYHEKKTANALSLNLINSTPARLRGECLAVFMERYNHHHDEQTLKLFFGHRNDNAEYLRAIRNAKAEVFKPLDNFLKGNTAQTEAKNIELLAWLVDVKPRPWQWDFDYTPPGKEKAPDPVTESGAYTAGTKDKKLKTEPVDRGLPERTTTALIFRTGLEHVLEGQPAVATSDSTGKKVRLFKLKAAILVPLVLFLTGGGLYWIWIKRTAGEQCMCWTGDHYRTVSCNEKLKNTPVYGMDSLKMIHFKRITTPDTLTQRSLGHVWYSKIGGEIEFYTADGFHPVHTERRLRPLTMYMLNKYAVKSSQLRTVVN